MNSLELIELQVKARFRQAYDSYRVALVSAHEAFPEAPNLFDCIEDSVIDYYCRCADDLNRVDVMMKALTHR